MFPSAISEEFNKLRIEELEEENKELKKELIPNK